MRNLLFGFLAMLALTTFSSCGKSWFFNQTVEVPNQVWTYGNVAKFELDIQDTTRIYNLYLDIDHTKEYAWQNICMKIYTQFPSGKKLDQVLTIDISEKDGKWKGKKGWGGDYNLAVVLREGLYFNEAGKYVFEFEQYMRQDSLAGIKNLTLKLEETDRKNH